MQRSWLGRLLFALALVVQASLPAAAALAHEGGGAGDAYELCWKAGSQSTTDQDRGSAPQHRRHAGCLFCQLSNPGATPFVATAASCDFVSCGSRPLRYASAKPLPARSQRESAPQARAPPQFS